MEKCLRVELNEVLEIDEVLNDNEFVVETEIDNFFLINKNNHKSFCSYFETKLDDEVIESIYKFFK